ncbi:MAG: bi-domain-containing oxidoreductase, partial [Thermoguttaceae bacterium]|nr:bi-domain-containing oxidoreductase [Thermoguttaceae bacterium]
PDLVRKVLAKLRRDGFLATFAAVREKLDREIPLGYSVSGEVVAVGAHAREFSAGQRVACAGAGYANHAEVNYVPRLLAVPVPEGVSTEAAAYATVGAIALQGMRNADVRAGEAVVVLGLGLIGQLAVQLLKAAGCRVVGLDVAQSRVDLAAAQGADLALAVEAEGLHHRVLDFTRGRGADAVLITAATTSSAPLELAAELARDRARVVLVGVTGMQVPRKEYYEKELTFIVSRSYGPGRYDRQYEERGHDYPPGYVRWTENRNLEAFLDLVAAGRVRPETLTTHRFAIADALAAFELILTNREPHLGVVLTYPQPASAAPPARRIELLSPAVGRPKGTVGVSFLGAGSFARSVLLPNLAKVPGVELRGICSASGVSARSAGEKYKFAFCASAEEELLADDRTDAVFIVTPHSRHADAVCRALAAGKAVFCEKPLAVTAEQVARVRQALNSLASCATACPLPETPVAAEGKPLPAAGKQCHTRLMVGFNRRFAPLARELKEHLAGRGPLAVHYRCNAGQLAADHWLASAEEGGRIIGEACHFFDFFQYLTDSEPVEVFARCPGPQTSLDEAQATVTYADGSVCHLLYTTRGPASYSKERIEVFAGGRVGVLEDFHTLWLESETGRHTRRRLFRPDKGHAAELQAFVEAVRGGTAMPIVAESLLATTMIAVAAVESMHRQQPVRLADSETTL